MSEVGRKRARRREVDRTRRGVLLKSGLFAFRRVAVVHCMMERSLLMCGIGRGDFAPVSPPQQTLPAALLTGLIFRKVCSSSSEVRCCKWKMISCAPSKVLFS